MTLRGRIFILITAIVLVVLSVSIFLLVRNRNKPPATNNTTDNTQNNISQITNSNVINSGGQKVVINKPTVVKDPLELEKAAVQRVASVFVERYQTYSTDNNYDNIRQVQDLVTDSLWNKLSPRLKVKQVNNGFVGVTSQAFSTDLKNWASDKATVQVDTRRTLNKDGKSTVTNQAYTVEMVKTGSDWLVDSFANN